MGKRRGADISHFIAIDKIEDGIITYKNRIIASVIKIDSLNLSLLDYEEQKIFKGHYKKNMAQYSFLFMCEDDAWRRKYYLIYFLSAHSSI